MKKVLSIMLVVSMLLVNCNLIYAENSGDRIYDASIDDYITIKILTSNNGISRVQGLDSLENIVYDYTCDYKNGYFYNNFTNVTEYFETNDILNELNSLDKYKSKNIELNLYSNDDIPNLCNGPSDVTDSISLKVLLGGTVISAGLIAIKLTAWLAAVTSFSSGSIKTVASGAIGLAASDIYSAITSGDWGKRVYFRINFMCSKMWESDPFDPRGGFYFYGSGVKDVDYLGTY